MDRAIQIGVEATGLGATGLEWAARVEATPEGIVLAEVTLAETGRVVATLETIVPVGETLETTGPVAILAGIPVGIAPAEATPVGTLAATGLEETLGRIGRVETLLVGIPGQTGLGATLGRIARAEATPVGTLAATGLEEIPERIVLAETPGRTGLVATLGIPRVVATDPRLVAEGTARLPETGLRTMLRTGRPITIDLRVGPMSVVRRVGNVRNRLRVRGRVGLEGITVAARHGRRAIEAGRVLAAATREVGAHDISRS
ncbi:MAG: hypothetical protein WBX22_10190 [Silvibacterium sp.]